MFMRYFVNQLRDNGFAHTYGLYQHDKSVQEDFSRDFTK